MTIGGMPVDVAEWLRDGGGEGGRGCGRKLFPTWSTLEYFFHFLHFFSPPIHICQNRTKRNFSPHSIFFYFFFCVFHWKRKFHVEVIDFDNVAGTAASPCLIHTCHTADMPDAFSPISISMPVYLFAAHALTPRAFFWFGLVRRWRCRYWGAVCRLLLWLNQYREFRCCLTRSIVLFIQCGWWERYVVVSSHWTAIMKRKKMNESSLDIDLISVYLPFQWLLWV